MKSMKISDLITHLKQAKKELGDLPVILSSDEEGNSFSTVQPASVSYMDTDKVGRVLTLFPYEEYIENQLFNDFV